MEMRAAYVMQLSCPRRKCRADSQSFWPLGRVKVRERERSLAIE